MQALVAPTAQQLAAATPILQTDRLTLPTAPMEHPDKHRQVMLPITAIRVPVLETPQPMAVPGAAIQARPRPHKRSHVQRLPLQEQVLPIMEMRERAHQVHLAP